jgi:hypothetical protein
MDEVESARHTWFAPGGLAEALPKPDKRREYYGRVADNAWLSEIGMMF